MVVRALLRRSRRSPRRLLLIDGANVRRSTWPNVDEPALVDALDSWAATEHPDADVVAYFDATREVASSTARVEVRSVPYADDEIVAFARDRITAGSKVLAATSDRELRRRLEEVGAEVPWGGGRLLGELGLGRRRGR